MTTLETIRETILDHGTLFGFEYHGKAGNIDPHYEGNGTYLLFFDQKETLAHSLEDVFRIPFVEGKTLSEVADQLIVTEN